MSIQGCAVSHQTSIVGLSQEVFSRVPALMNARSGMAPTWDTIGEPHFPQNRRSTGSPLSPTSSKVLSVCPAIVRLSFGTATITENDVPLCFWQCGQWQTAVSSGSALQVYLMLPHKQLPFILPTGRSLLLLSISPRAHPDVKFRWHGSPPSVFAFTPARLGDIAVLCANLI